MTHRHPATETIAGIVLAGGRSRRMEGRDKALIAVDGRTLLERAIAGLSPQVGPFAVNANSAAVRAAAGGVSVLEDTIPGHAGPLAGVLAGLDWARERTPAVQWLATVPVDAPLFPADLVARLAAAVTASGADVACATSGGRLHPVFGLWPVGSAEAMRRALVAEGLRRVTDWLDRVRVVAVEWPATPVDPFLNLNTPGDLAAMINIKAPRSR